MRTDAQRQASRANGSKSEGPITPEGKNISKFNGVKHGLRAEHVVLPGEDPAEFELEKQAWARDWNPPSHTRAVLVERAAAASWRLRRAVRAEADVLAQFADDAGRRFDFDRAEHIERLVDTIDHDPNGNVGRLRLCRGGIDRLIRGWRELGRALKGGPSGWNSIVYHHRLMLFLGFPRNALPPDGGEDAMASQRLLAVNDPACEVRPLKEGEGRALVGRLRRLVATHLRQLRDERRQSADPLEQRARAMATAAAVAHASKDAQLRHRYEMDIDRVLRGTINQLAMLVKSGVDLAEEFGTDPAAVEPVSSADRTAGADAGRAPETSPGPPDAKRDTATVCAAPGSVGAGDFARSPGVAAVPISGSRPSSGGPGRSRRRRSRR